MVRRPFLPHKSQGVYSMTIAIHNVGKPIEIGSIPSTSNNAGDVLIVGGIPVVAHTANPVTPGGSVELMGEAVGGGVYVMAADAAYTNGTFVFYDSVLTQVTAQSGANRIPFGEIVGGPSRLLSDGGPTGAASLCLVKHIPRPEMRFGQATFATGAFSAFGEAGNIFRVFGNPVAANAADATDDILTGFVLSANSFDLAGRMLNLNIWGKFGATGNNKKIRIWFNPNMSGQTVTNGVISGGTVTGAGSGVMAYDSTAQTGNNVAWELEAFLGKYGAAGSNTQQFSIQPIYGTTHGGVVAATFLTLPENANINVVITGSSSTTSAANDVVLQGAVAQVSN